MPQTPYNPKTMDRRVNTLPIVLRPLTGANMGQTRTHAGVFLLCVCRSRPSSFVPAVAVRFAAIMTAWHETSGKPRGEAQGCTTISVGRKAANGVPGCPRPHTLATPRYSALYRHDSRTVKCPPLLAGGGHFGGRGNRCRHQLLQMRTAAAGSTLA